MPFQIPTTGTLKIKGRSLDQFAADESLLEELAHDFLPDLRKWIPFTIDYQNRLALARKEIMRHIVRVLEQASRGVKTTLPVHIGFVPERGSTKYFTDSEGICASACMLRRSVVRDILIDTGINMAGRETIELPHGMALTPAKHCDDPGPGPEWYLTRVGV